MYIVYDSPLNLLILDFKQLLLLLLLNIADDEFSLNTYPKFMSMMFQYNLHT